MGMFTIGCCCGEPGCLAWFDNFDRTDIGPNWAISPTSCDTWDIVGGALETMCSGTTIAAIPGAINPPPHWTDPHLPQPTILQVKITANAGDIIEIIWGGAVGCYAFTTATWTVGSDISLPNRDCPFTDTSGTFRFCLDCGTNGPSGISAQVPIASVSVGSFTIACGPFEPGCIDCDWSSGSEIFGFTVVSTSGTVKFEAVKLFYSNNFEPVEATAPNCPPCKICCWPDQTSSVIPAAITVVIAGFTTGTIFGCTDAECAALNGTYVVEQEATSGPGSCVWGLDVDKECISIIGTQPAITKLVVYAQSVSQDCHVLCEFLYADGTIAYGWAQALSSGAGFDCDNIGCGGATITLPLTNSSGTCNGLTYASCMSPIPGTTPTATLSY